MYAGLEIDLINLTFCLQTLTQDRNVWIINDCNKIFSKISKIFLAILTMSKLAINLILRYITITFIFQYIREKLIYEILHAVLDEE